MWIPSGGSTVTYPNPRYIWRWCSLFPGEGRLVLLRVVWSCLLTWHVKYLKSLDQWSGNFTKPLTKDDVKEIFHEMVWNPTLIPRVHLTGQQYSISLGGWDVRTGHSGLQCVLSAGLGVSVWNALMMYIMHFNMFILLMIHDVFLHARIHYVHTCCKYVHCDTHHYKAKHSMPCIPCDTYHAMHTMPYILCYTYHATYIMPHTHTLNTMPHILDTCHPTHAMPHIPCHTYHAIHTHRQTYTQKQTHIHTYTPHTDIQTCMHT